MSGASRKIGSRNKLRKSFVADMHADWELHGPVIDRVRKIDPAAYLRVVASLMPRQVEAHVSVHVFHEARSAVEALRMASELTGANPDRAIAQDNRQMACLEVCEAPPSNSC
jgi:hypothetical protein